MNALDKILKAQSKNNSMICVGLDLDPKRMPADYSKNTKGMFDFAMQIIESTADQVAAYKPNIAFYESLGGEGISLLGQIVKRIPKDIPVILDAKRGDIGNTASHYAEAIFGQMDADWVTLNPYMGYDSLRPFLENKEKGAFILCLTSNTGSKDFQTLMIDGKPLYKVVAEKVAYWNKARNLGLVVGATAPEQLTEVRAVAEDMPLLIPGVGAQGGSLEKAVLNGTDSFQKPALINVSRSVLYASSGADFARKAREEVMRLNQAVKDLREGKQTEPENQQPPRQQQDDQQPNQPHQQQDQPQSPPQPQHQPRRQDGPPRQQDGQRSNPQSDSNDRRE